MSDRSHLYSPQSSPAELPPADGRTRFPAAVSRMLLGKVLAPTAEWRLPIYRDWWGHAAPFETKNGAAAHRLQRFTRAVQIPFRALARASYIEWRYYAVLCPEFHGIVGFALFNPEGYFPRVSEGGLLAIIAGVAGGPGIAARDEVAELCWMKLFPTSALRFSPNEPNCLEAASDGMALRIAHPDPGAANIRLCGPGAPQLTLQMRSIPGTSLHPTWGEDLRRIPGAHWVVHNAAPMAEIEGSMRLTSDCWPGARLPLVDYPTIVSPPLARCLARASDGLELHLHGSGYYEHSFGINPMPLHGWDFVYAPDVANRRAIVLQTYVRSPAMTYLEVLWQEAATPRYLRFPGHAVSLRWGERIRHPDIGVEVPGSRYIEAAWDGYRIEIENRIHHRVALLRPRRFLVRHFFISEEMSRTSWVLRDASGRVVTQATDVLSGGETAQLRVWV